MNTSDIKYTPGAYYFSISLESDLDFANRLFGKTKYKFIESVLKHWGVA